jgi:hypothetical protein
LQNFDPIRRLIPGFFLATLSKNFSLGVQPIDDSADTVAKYRLDLKTNPSLANPPRLPDAMRRVKPVRTARPYLKVLLSVPLVAGVLYFGSVIYNGERVVPKGVETVQDFYRRYGNPPRVDTLQSSGRQYFRITGEIPAPLGFPKGNPIYIFDNTGRLIDWTAESMNDPKFAARWEGIATERMTLEYFLDRFPPN